MLLRGVPGAVCAALLLASCSCGEPRAPDTGADVGRDVGIDAGRRDAGRDGGRDSGPDLGVDAGPRDGGPNDPEWIAIPDVPLGCTFERALHPERILTLEWASCGEGCEYIVRVPGFVGQVGWGSESEGTAVISMQLDDGSGGADSRSRITAFIDARSGQPLAAWRLTQPDRRGLACVVHGRGFGRGYLGFALSMADYESSEEHAWIFHGPIEEMRNTDEPVLRLDNEDLPGFGNLLQDAEVSDTTAIFQVQPLGEVWIVEEGVLHRRAGIRSAVPGSPQSIALVGRHAMWNEWRNDVRIAHATADEAAAVYLSVEGKRVTVATDGVDLAWLQGPWTAGVGFSESSELWTAPYVRDPADLAPRRVLERFDDGTLVGVIGAGMWAEGGYEVTLIDLETGIRREIATPRLGIFLGHPRWVTEDEVGISGRWSGYTGFFNTFFRLATSSAVVVE